MVCTNDDELYDYAKLYRSHGMTREASPKLQQEYKEKYNDVNPLFTFAVPGYNVRNQELNAVLGLSQMDRLDYNIECRKENLEIWLDTLDSNKFFTDYIREGNSNFSLPLILRKKDLEYMRKVCILLDKESVEFRVGTAGGGNHVHDYGLYVGNHPDLNKEQIIDLCRKLNNV
jgi:CDP-6-deoxy-D-xylo-4-hexulose-3-dehydrase